MAVTPNIGKLVDIELLKAFKAKQDAVFQDKLDEKEALGTAAGLVGTLTNLTTEAKTNVVAAINEVDANADKVAADLATANEKLTKTTNDLSALSGKVGDVETLTTTEKGTIVGAINEVKAAADTLNTASKVAMDVDDTARVYKIYQGGKEVSNLIGTINIGKDLVVKSGEVKEVDEKGTCLVLTLTNDDVVEIPVGTLIDIYTAQAAATQVQISIDPVTKVVGASLVANGVATTHIADKNVTKAKLADDVQTSLGKADIALQVADIEEGTTDYTVSVRGTDIVVHGVEDAIKAAQAAAQKHADDAIAPVKTTAEAAKATADKLDGTADVEGSVKAQIKALKDELTASEDTLVGRVTALETWKGTVGLATEADIDAMFA